MLALARAIDQAFYGVKLPRDFKIGISGCSRNCAAANCQCLGLVDNRDGFAVYIGGAENELTPVHGTLIATGVPGENVNVVVEIILKSYVYFAHKLIADGIVSAKPRLYEIIGKAGVGYFAQAVKAALYPDTGTTMMEEVPIELAPKDEVAAAMEEVTRLPGFTKENAFSAFIVLNQLCIHCLECQRYKCQVFIAKESIVGVSRTGQKFLSQIPTDILDIIRTLPMKKYDGFKIHEAFHTVSETCDHCRVVEHDLLCAVNVALTSLGCLINGRDYETYMDIQKKLLAK